MRSGLRVVLLLVLAAPLSAWGHGEVVFISKVQPADVASEEKVAIRFEGMLCMSCSRRISAQFKTVPDVRVTRFFRGKNLAEVLFPVGKVTREEVRLAVEAAGFDARFE